METRKKPDRDTTDYLNYLFDHPEIIRNQPPCALSGSYWLKQMLTGQCSGRRAGKEMAVIVKRWEAYHKKIAKSMGWEIDVEEFKKLFVFGDTQSRNSTH